MSNLIVEIAGMRITEDTSAHLVTYALGSCIAVTLYDPKRRCAGMIHYMLPSSSGSPEKGKERPAMFADTGVPRLFEGMYMLGSKKEDLIVTAVGGAQVHDEDGVFNIGKRNYAVLRKLFWKNNVLIAAEEVGGSASRTVFLEVATGRVLIKRDGLEYALWDPNSRTPGSLFPVNLGR